MTAPFDLLSSAYSQHDFLAREVARRMAERLPLLRQPPPSWLDLGCGQRREPLIQRDDTWVVGCDQSHAMLTTGRPAARGWRGWWRQQPVMPLVTGHAEALPFRSGCVAGVWSNLMLPWVDDFPRALREMHRVLTVEGVLMFSSLGPDSLREWRESFSSLDEHEHVGPFADMHDLGDALLHAGFADPVMDVEMITLTWPGFDAMLAEMRGLGLRNRSPRRARGLTGRRRWQAFADRMAARRKEDGRYALTLEIVYGHAWKPQPRQTNDGAAIIQFAKRN